MIKNDAAHHKITREVSDLKRSDAEGDITLYSTRGTYAAGRRLGRELSGGDIRAEAYMSVPCPTCDAPHGSWCVYTTTRPGTFQSIHAGRQRAVGRYLDMVTQEAAADRCVVGEPYEDYFICGTHGFMWEVDKQPYCNAEEAQFIWAAAFFMTD